MSSALKLATLAGSFGLLSASTMYAFKASPSRDFSREALSLEHTGEATTAAVKPKLPSNFISYTYGKYEIKNAA